MARGSSSRVYHQPCDMVANDTCPVVEADIQHYTVKQTSDAKKLSQMMTNDPAIIKQLCGMQDPEWLEEHTVEVEKDKHRLIMAVIRKKNGEVKEEFHLAWQNKPTTSQSNTREFQTKLYLESDGHQAPWNRLEDSAIEFTDPLFDVNLWLGQDKKNWKRVGIKSQSDARMKSRSWMLRAWRAFFPDDELVEPGKRSKAQLEAMDKPKNKAKDKGKGKGKATGKATTGSRKRKRQSKGEVVSDEDDDQVGQSEAVTKHNITNATDWWTVFDCQPGGFDLESSEVVKNIRIGWSMENSDDEAAAPPVEVLKAMQREHKLLNNKITAQQTAEYFEWRQSVSTGFARGRTTFVEYPSMEEREQKNREADQTSSKSGATTQAEDQQDQAMSEDDEEVRAAIKKIPGLLEIDFSAMDEWEV